MIIEIWTKEKYADNEEKALVERLSRAGLPVKSAKLSRLYNVDAPWPQQEFARLGADLLADRLTEKYSLSKRPGTGGLYRVEVWLKRSATDVIGESVKEAIHDMTGRAPAGVRFGRAYYIEGAGRGTRDAVRKLKEVVSKTLANEIVQTINIAGPGVRGAGAV